MRLPGLLAVSITLLLTLLSEVRAQGGAWAQCGGIGWQGTTNCVAGYTCTVVNPYYSQCLVSSTTRASTSIGPTTIFDSTSTKATASSTSTPTTTGTGAIPTGSQIRAVQDPVYHFYVQNSGGLAVLGPESSSGRFTISGSISLNSASGSKSYLNIANTTTSYKALTFGSTATFTGWGLEGDTIITTTSSVLGRQLNFLACASTGGLYTLYLQTGNDIPSGQTCSLISLHLPCLC